MNTAIKKAKKTLAVLLCVLIFSSFALPAVGAEGAIKWDFSKDGYALTVPKDAGDEDVLTLPEATLEGAEGGVEYSLVLVKGEVETELSEDVSKNFFGFSKDKPEITLDNSSKDYVYSKSSGTGVITLGMRAVCGALQSDICLIRVENYKVKATFSYLNNKNEYCDEETEVVYGSSVEKFADGIDDYKLPENNKNCHYIVQDWVDFSGKSTLTSVREDTTFVLPVSSEAHEIDIEGEDYSFTPATCTESGSETGKCKVCGWPISTVIPALGHDFKVTKEGKEPSCFEAGCTEGKRCNVCGYEEESTIIPAIGHHTEVTDSAVDPTCTEPGLTEGKHCIICKKITVPQETISANGHNFVTMQKKDATCLEDGYKEGKRCTVCEAPETEDLIIPALGHNSVDVTEVPAKCEKDGSEAGKKCARCGVIIEGCEVIPAKGHTETKIKEAVPPTCTSTGLTRGFTCSVCHKVFEQEVVPMLDHTEEIIPAVAPTCTETGLTEGKKCSACQTVIVAQEVVSALGHDMVVSEAGYEATCTEKGLTDKKTCSRCGVVEEQKEIPAKGHTLVTEYGRDATCTEDGLSDKIFCSRCNEVIQEAKEIPSFGGHADLDNDGFCDRCGTEVEKPQPGNTCGCICHKDGIVGWLWKSILCPIIKLFGIEQKCKCGVDHWTK